MGKGNTGKASVRKNSKIITRNDVQISCNSYVLTKSLTITFGPGHVTDDFKIIVILSYTRFVITDTWSYTAQSQYIVYGLLTYLHYVNTVHNTAIYSLRYQFRNASRRSAPWILPVQRERRLPMASQVNNTLRWIEVCPGRPLPYSVAASRLTCMANRWATTTERRQMSIDYCDAAATAAHSAILI